MQDLVILSDFDGTIAIQDVNNAIYDFFGDEENEKIEEEYREGNASDKETLLKHYSHLNFTRAELRHFVYSEIDISPGFEDFYQFVRECDIKFAIVSGGFINYINFLFEKEGICLKSPIYANLLKFKGENIEPIFPFSSKDCNCISGPCGTCKKAIINKYKNESDYLIYLGDGRTDRSAAREADLVLVKEDSYLENFCQKEGLNFQPFIDFTEANEIINKIYYYDKPELLSSR